jgi:hypothetical protein
LIYRPDACQAQKEEIPMKRWRKPELTALVRSRPEEAVLTGCTMDAAIDGPGGGVTTCHEWNPKQLKCGLSDCVEIAVT